MHSQSQLRSKNDSKKSLKHQKSFSSRNPPLNLPPYSRQFAKAKQKAFERYKQIYPVQNKQNLYPITKTPMIGYYLMKGYKKDQCALKENSSNNISKNKSSDKVITHLLKKYLERKENTEAKMLKALPKIDHSITTYHEVNTAADHCSLKNRFARVLTEYDTRIEKSRPMINEL